MKYIMLLLAVCPSVLLANDLPAEDPYFEAVCEGRWPGRYIELTDSTVYDCNTMTIIDKSSLPDCDDLSTEECI